MYGLKQVPFKNDLPTCAMQCSAVTCTMNLLLSSVGARWAVGYTAGLRWVFVVLSVYRKDVSF